MATLENLAEKYVSVLRSYSDQSLAISKVVNEIKQLKYSGSKAPISLDDRKRIISLMREIGHSTNFSDIKGMTKMGESVDALIELINSVDDILNKK